MTHRRPSLRRKSAFSGVRADTASANSPHGHGRHGRRAEVRASAWILIEPRRQHERLWHWVRRTAVPRWRTATGMGTSAIPPRREREGAHGAVGGEVDEGRAPGDAGAAAGPVVLVMVVRRALGAHIVRLGSQRDERRGEVGGPAAVVSDLVAGLARRVLRRRGAAVARGVLDGRREPARWFSPARGLRRRGGRRWRGAGFGAAGSVEQ